MDLSYRELSAREGNVILTLSENWGKVGWAEQENLLYNLHLSSF